MVFYILVVYFCTTLISQVFLLLQIFNTVTLRMPFTRNHYHGTGSAKHSSYSYMTRALRALVCNWMSSCFAKPSSVIMISCKRYISIALSSGWIMSANLKISRLLLTSSYRCGLHEQWNQYCILENSECRKIREFELITRFYDIHCFLQFSREAWNTKNVFI